MSAEWIELSIEAPPEYAEPLSEIFHRYGEGGVAIEQPAGHNPDEGETPPLPDSVTIKTYLPADDTADSRQAQIDVGVRLVSRFASVSELRQRRVSEDEWQNGWKDFFHVLRVGQRVVICPTWREYEPRPDDVIIHLDPGMAFGTGHHPTTRLCLETIERIMPTGARVLDLGCGSGILSMAAALLGAESAVGFEIEPVAARSGRDNVALNKVGDRVEVVQGTLPSPKAPAQSFDLVVANISARVIIDLAPQLADCVAPGGTLLASGVIEKHLDDETNALKAAGATIHETLVDGDWTALIASV